MNDLYFIYSLYRILPHTVKGFNHKRFSDNDYIHIFSFCNNSSDKSMMTVNIRVLWAGVFTVTQCYTRTHGLNQHDG